MIQVFGDRDGLAGRLARRLSTGEGGLAVRHVRTPAELGKTPSAGSEVGAEAGAGDGGRPRLVWVAPTPEELGTAGGGEGVEPVLDALIALSASPAGPEAAARLVIVASAEIYEPNPHHPGMASEEQLAAGRRGNPRALHWRRLEERIRERLGAAGLPSLVLRPPAVPVASGDGRAGRDFWSRLLGGGLAVPLPGHDPTIQLLSLEDLARAVLRALGIEAAGGHGSASYKATYSATYNLAPAGAIPLREALRRAGVLRLPLPHWLREGWRRLAARLPAGLAGSAAVSPGQLDYLRWCWTVSGEAAARDLGFEPRDTSVAAVEALCRELGRSARPGRRPEPYDDYGLDPVYVRRLGATLFRFFYRLWWRVETRGLERVPAEGPAVLVGVHRGFMPFDAVMALHEIRRERGRIPRFLVHPGLLRFPFFFDFITRLGGVMACRENARRILERGEILGLFPEGVRGAFSLYRDAYEIQSFGRADFVRFALGHRAPLLPFVTLGSAEIFPILAKIESRWWRRHAEWPFIPVTPTFPLLPLPLPTKWHIWYLEPMEVGDQHPPEAAEDPDLVRELAGEVRRRLQAALDELRGRRRSWFRGSVFEGDGVPPPPGERGAGE